jgi:RNA polymerase sigma-70 factor, ECF subfamily
MTSLNLRLPDDGADGFASGQDLVDLLPRLRSLAGAVARDPDEAGELVELTLADLAQSRHRAEGRAFGAMVRIWDEQFAARPARVLMADEHDSEVRGEVARLPDDQRLPVALVMVGGLSYREAAAALQVSVGSLTQRLSRARGVLLDRLERRIAL